ncbi:MAG TPA: extracellular solute-binding protein [Burkholderiales bacterium]|nr:extracellular solute-binding protein [Burkholderiales bacterium]
MRRPNSLGKRIIRTIVCATCVAGILALPTNVLAQQLRMYAALSKVNVDKIVAFVNSELKTDIVALTLSTGPMHAKIMAEAPNVEADLVLTLEWSALKMQQAGLTEPYPNPPSWRDIDGRYKSPAGHWFNLGTYSYLLIANKKRLEEKGFKVPQSYDDLLDPKWKGEIVMPSPVFSGTGTMFMNSMFSLKGSKEEGWKYLEKLDKNIAQYTKSGNLPTLLVSRGEYMLAITSDAQVAESIAQGYPITYAIPKEGVGADGNMILITKSAKNKEAAKRVVDFMGTEKFQRFFSQLGYLSARQGLPNPLYKETPKFIDYDHVKAADDVESDLAAWKMRFQKQ